MCLEENDAVSVLPCLSRENCVLLFLPEALFAAGRGVSVL